MTFKGFFKGFQVSAHPQLEQQAYEDRLYEAMKRVQAAKGAKAES